MDKQFVTPRLPIPATLAIFAVVLAELIIYGQSVAVPAVWVAMLFGGFYLGFVALVRRDSLPLIFALLFFTAHHGLLFNYNRNLPIALLFLITFGIASSIMWILLHYATHLKREHHTAYSVISGFMIAQILVIFASMAREWPFRFELAAYMPTVFSYVFWRFACFSADSVLGWRQFWSIMILVIVLIIVIVIGSPKVGV